MLTDGRTYSPKTQSAPPNTVGRGIESETSASVVPANELDEVLVEGEAGFSVERAAERGREEVGRDNLLVRVAEDALETSLLTSCFHCRLDLLVGRLHRATRHLCTVIAGVPQ